MFSCSRLLRGLLVASTLLSLSAPASAQEWPARPIRLIVNFAAGSSPDVIGRAVATPLSQALGQPVTVENRAGAGGIVGAEAVAKAPGDGYTLLMASGSSFTIAPFLQQKMPYDTARDFAPVAAAARIEVFLVSRADLPFQNYAEFIKFVKANPGKLSYASPGNGSSPHIAGEMLKAQAGFFAVHIPYRGSSPALQDLLAGQVDYYFDPGIATPHVRAGKLRVLATASNKRSFLYPETPTLQELGLKDFDAGTTHAFFAPASTPPAVVDRLNREINRILATPPVVQAIRALGAEPSPMSIAEFRTLIERDSKRYAAIIQSRGIKPD